MLSHLQNLRRLPWVWGDSISDTSGSAGWGGHAGFRRWAVGPHLSGCGPGVSEGLQFPCPRGLWEAPLCHSLSPGPGRLLSSCGRLRKGLPVGTARGVARPRVPVPRSSRLPACHSLPDAFTSLLQTLPRQAVEAEDWRGMQPVLGFAAPLPGGLAGVLSLLSSVLVTPRQNGGRGL